MNNVLKRLKFGKVTPFPRSRSFTEKLTSRLVVIQVQHKLITPEGLRQTLLDTLLALSLRAFLFFINNTSADYISWSTSQQAAACANSSSGSTNVAKNRSESGNAAEPVVVEPAKDVADVQQESPLFLPIAATARSAWYVKYGVRWTRGKSQSLDSLIGTTQIFSIGSL
jgi:hypothetical protein